MRSEAVASASDYRRGWDNTIGVLSEPSSFNAAGFPLNGISSVTLLAISRDYRAEISS